jgi:hypothetical protein
MLWPDVAAWITTHWVAMMAGLLGLAVRLQSADLPNGGAEPKSILEHMRRLVRIWIEATAGAFLLGLLATIATIFKEDVMKTEAIPLLLAVAVFAGAAFSNLLARWFKDARLFPQDIADSFSKLVDVWRRFKGDPPTV